MSNKWQYRKKPVVIEAFQHSAEGIGDGLPHWFVDAVHNRIVRFTASNALEIHTLEGVMTADVGDWIICGVKGELYPCKPDIFAATYDPVGDDNEPVAAGATLSLSVLQQVESLCAELPAPTEALTELMNRPRRANIQPDFDPASGPGSTVITLFMAPRGCKIVPLEPTPQQWAAGVKAMEAGIDKVTQIYKAMIAVDTEVK